MPGFPLPRQRGTAPNKSSTGKYIGPRALPSSPDPGIGGAFHAVDNFFDPVAAYHKFASTAKSVYDWGHATLPATAAPLPKRKARVKPTQSVNRAAGFSGDGSDTAPPIQRKPVKVKGTPARSNVTVTPTKTSSGGAPTPSTPGGSSYTPLTYEQLSDLARKQAQFSVDASAQPYLDAITQNQTLTANHEKAINGFALALAELMKPQGGQIAGIYGQSADALAQYAKGYSDQSGQLRADAGANAVAGDAGLTPQQQAEITKAYAGTPTDVMYGLGGKDTATTLREVGAGVGAAYDKATPGIISGYGQQWLGASHAQALKTLQDLQLKLAEAKGQFPKVYQDTLSGLQDSARKDESLYLTEQATGMRNRATAAGITGYDPVTGLPTAKTRHDQQLAALADKKYAVQVKQLGLSDARLKLQYVKEMESAKAKRAYHGLTEGRYKQLAGKALGLARIAHKPTADGHPPVSWQTYLDGALNKSIPMWVVIEQGRRVYSREEIEQGLIPGGGEGG